MAHAFVRVRLYYWRLKVVVLQANVVHLQACGEMLSGLISNFPRRTLMPFRPAIYALADTQSRSFPFSCHTRGATPAVR